MIEALCAGNLYGGADMKPETSDLLCGVVPKPSNYDHWNRAMQGVYLKGIKACIGGKTLADCPYEDKRKPSGRLSWSRAFIICWMDGFKAAAKCGA